MLQDAAIPTDARQAQLYGAMQNAKQPDLARMYDQMNQGLYGTGRQGLETSGYGGTPEQYAFERARQEGMSADWLQAHGMAMSENLQDANIGSQALQSSFMPYKNLTDMFSGGLNAQQLRDTMNREQNSLWSQLGIGGLANSVNYDNIKGKAFGDFIKATTPIAGQIGDTVGGADWGGIWDDISTGNWGNLPSTIFGSGGTP